MTRPSAAALPDFKDLMRSYVPVVMARELRYIPGGMLVETTTRTIEGRFLLRPSRELNDLVVGILARAKARYPVEVCAPIALSNHMQMLLCPEDGEALASFLEYVNGNIAREVNRLLGRRGPFWERRYKAIVVSDDAEDQEARLRYLLRNGTKEGLVWSPRRWPGVHCAEALLTGRPLRGVWYDRTAMFEARQRGEDPRKHDYATAETLDLDPLPCWRDLSAEERRARAKELVLEVEEETRTRHSEAGTSPMGVKAILRQDPHAKPAKSDRSPAPRFHASRFEVWVSLKEGYRQFRVAFRQAANDLRGGRPGVQFPEGSFPPGMPFVRGSPRLAIR